MMKSRQKRYTKAKKSGKTVYWDAYRAIQKVIKKEIKISHHRYLMSLFDESQGGGIKKMSFMSRQARETGLEFQAWNILEN